VFSLLSRWQLKALRSGAGLSRRCSSRPTYRPRVELLEDRCVPSTLTVNKADDDVTEKHTLRWAVANAVSGDEIQITAALKNTPIVLTQGELVLSQNVTIEGVGNVAETVSGGGTSRIFEVAAGTSVTIENLTLTGGNGLANLSDTSNFLGDGGCILMHGTGTLTVSGCTLSGNSASRNGGAIYNDAGSVVLSGCTLSGNSAGGDGGAIVNTAGSEALLISTNTPNAPEVLHYDSTIGAPIGSGVFTSSAGGGGLTFGPNGNLFIPGNLPIPGGGGVLEFNGTTGAPVGNGVFVPGAPGAFDLAFGPNGNLFVTSRFTGPNLGNGATGQVLEFDGKTGAPIGNGIFVQGGTAGLYDPYGLAFGPNGNLFVVDGSNARVLQYDGTTGAPVGTGVFLPSGTASVGLAFGPNGNLFVGNGNVEAGQGPFPGKILEFNSTTGAPVGSGIFVPAGSSALKDPLGMAFGPNGNLYVVDGGEPGQVFEFDGTTGAPVNGGVFIPAGSAGLSEPRFLAFDGGNSSSGTVSLSDCTLTGNTANTGGGISNHGTLTVTDSTLSANSSSTDGGGIFNVGTLTISGSTLSGNSAGADGGGVYNSGGGTVSVSGSTFSGNSASGDGGGIFNNGATGTVTVKDSDFTANIPDSISGPGGYVDLGGNTFK
jgi:hypothetical protein